MKLEYTDLKLLMDNNMLFVDVPNSRLFLHINGNKHHPESKEQDNDRNIKYIVDSLGIWFLEEDLNKCLELEKDNDRNTLLKILKNK